MFSEIHKTPTFLLRFSGPAAGYSPRTGLGPSTIAASELNFRVRDGNGCNITAWATGHVI